MRSCCVPFCKTNKYTARELTFHEIPADLDLREKWLKAISRKDWVPNDRASVCSLHFRPEDFNHETKYTRLKRGTVPSIFEGYPSYMQKKVRQERSRAAINKRELCLAAAKLAGNQVKKKTQKILPQEQENVIIEEHLEGPIICDAQVQEVPIQCDACVQEVPIQCDAFVQVNVIKTVQNKELNRWKRRTRIAKAKAKKVQEEFVNYKNAQKSKFTHLFRKVAKAADDNNTYAMFIMDQIQNFGSMRARWSEPTIRECIKWRGISNRGYEQARRLVHLPSRSTLARFSSVSVNGTGDESVSECVQHKPPADEEPVALDFNSEDRNDWSVLAMCVEIGSDTINGMTDDSSY